MIFMNYHHSMESILQCAFDSLVAKAGQDEL
jgi:hypothetical protein